MSSIMCRTRSEGGEVKRVTTRVVAKLSSMPTVPMPSGEIPKSQFSAWFDSGATNLNQTM